MQNEFAKAVRKRREASGYSKRVNKKMKAIVAYAPGDYRFEVVDTPRAGEGEMILKVEACGICAGDVKAFHGAKSSGAVMGILPILRHL